MAIPPDTKNWTWVLTRPDGRAEDGRRVAGHRFSP